MLYKSNIQIYTFSIGNKMADANSRCQGNKYNQYLILNDSSINKSHNKIYQKTKTSH